MNLSEDTIVTEFNKTIWKNFLKGLKTYQLIEDGDKIAVCISGGKDSMLMAKCMQRWHRYGNVDFEVCFIVMNPGYSEKNFRKIEENAEKLGLPMQIFETKIFESVAKEKHNPCFLCSRLRRGYLYKTAQELGCNKIALGHHFDDVIETILMGMLYGSQMQTMMPKIHSENYKGMEVIRPLYLVREGNIIKWAESNELSFIDCACRVTEGREVQPSKRLEIKNLLKQLRAVNPEVDMNIFRSAENVNLQTLISYHIGDEYHHFLDSYGDGKSVRGT
ncbi:MAG: tRNA 2-thiocytidine biosynthesis protein TtcA [Ruminococcus flavefaciens]|nr:tRNA 2-thiocytidine biosynthesis protein TtcA [Ruminococcus flavefaciens]